MLSHASFAAGKPDAERRSAGSPFATYLYDGPGRVRRRDLGNGTRQWNTWDGVDNDLGDLGVRRLREVWHFRLSDSQTIDRRRLTWNAAQDKTGRSDIRSGGPLPDAGQSFFYDSVNRMVASWRTAGGGTSPTFARPSPAPIW